MAFRARSVAVVHGQPDPSQSAWVDSGQTIAFAAFSAAGRVAYITLVPQVTSLSPDTLAANTPIMRLFGAQILLDSALTAQAGLSLGIQVIRANAVVGGQSAFGWLSSGAGTPAFSAQTTVQMPALTGNTAFDSATRYVAVRPGDAIVLVAANTVPSVPLGAVSVFMQ